MKKCRCSLGKMLFKLFLKLFVVEPFLKKHYDDMERKDALKDLYDVDKYPKREY